MPSELVVFRLKSAKDDSAGDWIEELNAYLSQALNGNIAVTERDADRAADALWIGAPFILVGKQEEAKRFIGELSGQARRILNDHAYYWVLSDSDQFFLSPERTVVLSWDHRHFEIIASRLKLLLRYPRLAGLSRRLHKIRLDIDRITAGRKGPWSPVLILGESGTGKEEVANTLYEAHDFALYKSGENKKDPNNFTALSCGTFSETLLPSQLFGIGPRIASGVDAKDGLLKLGSDGCVFLDDYDTALNLIQGPLLRIMATKENEPAVFYRVGEENIKGKEQKTWVWLLFSTNADIVSLLREEKLRKDFIFRFKDRIIHIPPLKDRPADIPAISLSIWNSLWKEDDLRKRFLTPPVLQHLLSREMEWNGNVRSLQTMLSLTASMASLPVHNHLSLRQIIDRIMPPDSDFYDWVGIVLRDDFSGRIITGAPDVQAVLDLDEGFDCLGSSREPSIQTGSEREANAVLSDTGRQAFEAVLAPLSEKKEMSNSIRPRIRLSRMIVYVARFGKIDKHIVVDLCDIGETKAAEELKMLEAAGILPKEPKAGEAAEPAAGNKAARKANRQTKEKVASPPSEKKTRELSVYVKAPGMFQV